MHDDYAQSINGIYDAIEAKISITRLQNETIRNTVALNRLNVNIIQIQQRLTDISATRAAEGYDDGFAEAENNYKEGSQTISALKSSTESDEFRSQLTSMQQDMDAYYKMGKEMANAYIASGSEGGNQFMEKFDPFAAKISANIGLLQKQNLEELDTALNAFKADELFMLYLSLIIMVLSVGSSVGLAVYITKTTTSPLKMFQDKFHTGASGDLMVSIEYNKNNEIGDMSRSFNTFFSKLRNLVSMIKATSDDIRLQSSGLSAASEQFSATFAEQSGQINSIASAVEEMAATSQDIMSRLSSMTETINSTSEYNNGAKTELGYVSSKIMEIKDASSKLSLIMSELRSASEEIGIIINTINDIADQTNLLALNAAIEAARAGEHGRGFAVVADEVRKLAERTQTSTQEIDNIVKTLQSKTEHAHENMESSVCKVNEGVGLMRSMQEKFNEIDKQIQLIISEQQGLTVAMHESSEATANINMSIQEIAQGIAQTGEAINTIAATANRLDT